MPVVAAQWDGRRLTPEILADTVAGLLWLEDRYRREVEATNATVTAAEPRPADDDEYPDVIVIDDDCDDDEIAV